MDEPEDLIANASTVAQKATCFDADGHSQAAVYLYNQAVALLERASSLGFGNPAVNDRIVEYRERAAVLELKANGREALTPQVLKGQSELSRANFLLLEGLDQDTNGSTDEAIELYSTAVQLCLDASQKTADAGIREKLRQLANQALSRAETLKSDQGPSEEPKSGPIVTSKVRPAASSPLHSNASGRIAPPLGANFFGIAQNQQAKSSSTKTSQSVGGLKLSGAADYTKEELEVLRRTSKVNSREYLPFMTSDLREKFAYSIPYTDKDGALALAPKQKKNFHHWARPEELSSTPRMIEVVDCFSIKQTCVSDCSFVASLAISALYEKRFKRRLITDIVYPKNRAGDPVYNPCGKYMIKLHINGIARKVVIDDYLPVDSRGSLLCSYSTNQNEFWISLIEKAYMKVMGGYDFPGSNSNIDLYALTEWIPERISMKDPEFNKDATFRKILDRFHKGDVLVTVATGEMSDAAADRAGLVSTHAYAMLDIKEVKGKRLLLLKNPWSHLRWKGNYSELDQTHWTPELCQALNYDPQSAQMFDNGVFWIDYDSLCHFFDVIYMNWNPSLFSYTFCTHRTWLSCEGPIRDVFSIGENPQFSLEVQSPGGAAVWVLLSRHIMQIDDFRNNQEYITLLVYKAGGKKIFYPNEPPPYIDGVRINSPHYLCKMVLKDAGTQKFTLVVSQYEKHLTTHYTLRVFSSCPFSLHKIRNICKHKVDITGKWTGISAGGCQNHPLTYKNNPMYQFRIESDMAGLRVELKAPKEIQVGFEIICVEAKNTESKGYFSRKHSGSFRSGFVVVELQDVVAGVYNVVPSTFLPGQEAPYYMTVFSSQPVKICQLK